ncbi:MULTISPECIES: sigma-70 RNA polymerase sigma factor region 4 domain-containing protein [Levilactobacillus]|uniref:DNA-directed RNA polymerase specialized sigma subunit, sigma24-like n=1 Tax=Levilactobacillus paucivorans TaxID=616990 RepID=A0A0R2LQE6_9LACO|nr:MULTISPECIES: sigma-70 family RNA polymerase sigma factor [Levilactobacillus]KRO03832.1 DNA-directed RNA polymerase specialized sigma subunit, sigma24-like [Levilactobacillus paucivorans]
MDNDVTPAYRFLFTGDHEAILYGALKRLHLTPAQNDYEDYLQEARLLFPAVYAEFPDDPEANPHQFLAYAQQKITWTLADQLRRDRRQDDRQAPGDQEELLTTVPADEDVLASIGLTDYRAYLVKLIGAAGNTGEWRFLVGTLVDQLTAAEIATRHGVNLATVYRWRLSLTRRLIKHLTPPDRFF